MGNQEEEEGEEEEEQEEEEEEFNSKDSAKNLVLTPNIAL